MNLRVKEERRKLKSEAEFCYDESHKKLRTEREVVQSKKFARAEKKLKKIVVEKK